MDYTTIAASTASELAPGSSDIAHTQDVRSGKRNGWKEEKTH